MLLDKISLVLLIRIYQMLLNLLIKNMVEHLTAAVSRTIPILVL